MAELKCLMALVFLRLSFPVLTKNGKQFNLLKLPALCSALLLAAGCSHQAVTASKPAKPVETAVQVAPPAAASPKWELPIPEHPSVDAWVKRFSGRDHKGFQTQLDRACYYTKPAQRIFEQRGLPRDLMFVALVESGFVPNARSHANAVGMWQIVSKTGNRFGLEQTRWVDERKHPLKSADAAAKYLSLLYDQFQSWPLALAAYNAGENAVQRELDRSGAKTFWELQERGYLPAETRDYVPKVIAAVKIARSPQRYGFRFDPNYYVQKHETVSIPGGVKLSWLGKQTGISEETLRNCNPELNQSVTPPGCSEYELCVPVGSCEEVLAALTKHPQQEQKPERKVTAAAAPAPAPVQQAPRKQALASYRVKPGDTWTGLARQNQMSVSELASLNGASPSRPLKTGQTVKLPVKETVKVAAAVTNARPRNGNEKITAVATSTTNIRQKRGNEKIAAVAPNRKNAPETKQQKQMQYMVRQGDSLSTVADKFNIQLKTLCAMNRVNPNQKLIPGTVLTVSMPQQESVKMAKKKGN